MTAQESTEIAMAFKPTDWSSRKVKEHDLWGACIHEYAHAVVANHFGWYSRVVITPRAEGDLERRHFTGQCGLFSAPPSERARGYVGLAGFIGECLLDQAYADDETIGCDVMEALAEMLDEPPVVESGSIYGMSATDAALAAGCRNRYRPVVACVRLVRRLWPLSCETRKLLAQKLRARGFANLADYLNDFKDPETGAVATNEREFSEIAAKISSAPVWMPKEPLKGEPQISGWAEFRQKGIYNNPRYALKRGWGGKFSTPTKKYEFYTEAAKKGLEEHAKKFTTSVDDIMTVSGYVARGDLAFVPHYEPPKRHGSAADYPLTFIDFKSRLNREGRSQNLPEVADNGRSMAPSIRCRRGCAESCSTS